MIDLSIKIGNLKLKNPVMLASGTCGPEQAKFAKLEKIGAIITKSVTLNPTIGNLPPRTTETVGGMLNSIGLENPGTEKFIQDKLPDYLALNTPVIVNVAAQSQEGYITVARKLNDTDISGFEINVSCPNVKGLGVEFGKDPQVLEELTSKIRKATSKPIIIKLSPNVTDIQPLAHAAENGGADAVSLINTLYGLKINLETKTPELGNITGGLSGPCIKPVALYYVYKVAQVCKIPVIGIGGIINYKDALEFLVIGASAIQIGTANFFNPNTGPEIAAGIKNYCEQQGVKNIQELIGSRKF